MNMDTNTVEGRLTEVFRDVFDSPSLTVTRATTAQDVDGWDSLTHVNLVLAVEKAFRIRFTTSEIVALKNVGDLQDLIQRKATS